jgi:hypothetical protein
MAEYIGGKPKKRGGGTATFIFISILALAAFGTYVYFDYVWPTRIQQSAVDSLIRAEDMIMNGCKASDVACQKRLSKAINEVEDNTFSRTLKNALSTEEVAKHLKKAHEDGSICFLVDDEGQKAPSDDVLVTWLDDYGSQKFLNDKSLIARARHLYEGRYLKPTPELYQLKLFRKLRWRHIPFGKTWREYTLASRFLESSSLARGTSQPTSTTSNERRMMKAMKKNPVYFTDSNIERLTQLAKQEMTKDRLENIKKAVRRFRNDVRELPLNEDKTSLALVWLSSKEKLHPWLKRRWNGPYVEKTELVDMWGCPIVGTRVPKTGAMSVISYGSDCTEGGVAEAKDIEVAIVAYTPPKKKAVVKKSRRRSRKKKKKID